jgi:hypothetical protein
MRHLLPRLTLLVLALAAISAIPACTQPPPQVLCTLRNPQTGQTVTMYKEIPFKVPANYDEQKHIAQWKQDQAAKGFTVEVPPAN